MTGDERGQYSSTMLQHIRAGKPLNDNQKAMLPDLGISPLSPLHEIVDALEKQVRRNPPRYCMTPEITEDY